MFEGINKIRTEEKLIAPEGRFVYDEHCRLEGVVFTRLLPPEMNKVQFRRLR